jgi:Zn-dependent oligopeptidase
MLSLRSSGLFNGVERRPHIINAGNFTPATKDAPSLLSLDDVITIFHELGHGLHGMLTKTRYRSLSGTAITWDMAELPSQLNENWALEPEVLDVYAHHYQTGERIPNELVEKARKAENFQVGLSGLAQVRYAMLDLALHADDLSSVKTADDVAEWENKVLAPYRIVPPQPGTMISPTFSHIFSIDPDSPEGYSAGYYSYLWTQVYAADAFSVFKKNGIFDPATSKLFQEHILEKGGSENAAELYRRFRGGEADPDALLRKQGLL